MTIKEATESLKKIKEERIQDDSIKKRMDALIGDLDEQFANVDELDEQIAQTIKYADSDTGSVDYNWVCNLHRHFFQMWYRLHCKKQLNSSKGKIDGETAQWVTTVVQGIIGIVSVVFTVLFALGIMPNIFGVLGENQNTDALYYIIGTIGQQAVSLIVGIIIGIINKRRIESRYNNDKTTGGVSFEELLAVKYADKPTNLKLLSPMAYKISKSQIAIGNNNKQVIIGKQKANEINNQF